MFRVVSSLIIVCLLFFVFPQFATAQTTTPSVNLETLVNQLQTQIQGLQAQISDLQAQLQSVKTELKFSRVLARGASGDDVKQLQEFLRTFPDVYPGGLVTGYFGPRTEAAVRKFQEQNGIESLGIVGPKTQAKLNELVTTDAEQPGVLSPGLASVGNPSSSAPSGTIPATPAIPAISPASATSTVPATPATPAIPGNLSPPPSPPTPPPSPTPPSTSPPPTSPVSPLTLPPPPPSASSSFITVTDPNGGEVLDRYNYAVRYDSQGVSKVGYKILKSSQVVYETATPTNVDASQLSFDPYTVLSASQSGGDFKIRVYDWDYPTVYDESDANFTIFIEKTPPVVSSVAASSITADSATITWITDEPATGQVNYGTAGARDWIVTPQVMSLSTSHSFTLSNLTSSHQYSYRVYSVDARGNGPEGLPPEHTFTTMAPVPTPTAEPSPTSTAASATSPDYQARNLAAIARILESLKAIMEKLLKLL